MPRYMLAVVRTSYYEIEAASPALAWGAYLDAEEVDHDHEETEGHAVYAIDLDGRMTGPCLFAEGDLVPGMDEGGIR